LGLELGEVRRAVDLNGKLDALQYEIGRFRQRLRRERLRRSVSGGNPDRVELALEPIEFTHKETREILQHLRNIKQIVENSSLFLGRKEAVLSRIIALLFYTSELNNDDNVNFESPELTENNF
jgi:hypothetical protein